jgi:hypothetical protein
MIQAQAARELLPASAGRSERIPMLSYRAVNDALRKSILQECNRTTGGHHDFIQEQQRKESIG